MAGRFTVEAVFKAVNRITAPVSKMQNDVGKFTRTASRNFRRLNRRLDNFRSGMKSWALAVVASFALVSGTMADTIFTGAKFEQSIVSAVAKFPGEIKRGSEAFKALESAARKTGKTTEFTANQSAQALNFLAMAGFNAEQAISALPGVVDLATAAQMDLGRASDISTDVLGAFGLTSENAAVQAKNLARVTDVLAKTSVSANTTVEQLFQSMRKGGPVATVAGTEIETVAAMIATMANAGTKAELAGTATANAFLNLTSPASKASKTMRRLGIDVFKANGELKDMPAIIDDLNKKTAQLSKAKRLSVFEEIFGREGLAGISTMISKGGDAMRAYREELRGASGETKRMADIMRDTFLGKFAALKSAIEGVKISVFNLTEGPLVEVIEKTTEWIRTNESLIAGRIGEWINYIVNNISEIVTWVKRVAIGIGIFIAFTSALKTFAAILLIVNLLVAANPIVLIVVAVIAAIAAITAMVIWIEEILVLFDKMPATLKFAFAPIWLALKGIKLLKDGIGWVISKSGKYFGSNTESNPADKLPDAAKTKPEEETGSGSEHKVVTTSPQQRASKSLEERITTNKSEIRISDETGRASIAEGGDVPGLSLEHTAAF